MQLSSENYKSSGTNEASRKIHLRLQLPQCGESEEEGPCLGGGTSAETGRSLPLTREDGQHGASLLRLCWGWYRAMYAHPEFGAITVNVEGLYTASFLWVLTLQ